MLWFYLLDCWKTSLRNRTHTTFNNKYCKLGSQVFTLSPVRNGRPGVWEQRVFVGSSELESGHTHISNMEIDENPFEDLTLEEDKFGWGVNHHFFIRHERIEHPNLKSQCKLLVHVIEESTQMHVNMMDWACWQRPSTPSPILLST